ncbi:MAG: hypothetical protein QM621_12785 [Aeromicrobium sp.]|uniref:hypothetical protein n=1 Tax=Aeromicrobium sp. TaxID=1871063 RepID=UPI0039E2CF60
MTRARRIASALAAVGLLSACQLGGGASTGGPTPPAEIVEHEGGPESPIMQGLTVPEGATQLGPLARFRSARLIAAYQPDLTVALARQGVNDAIGAARANPDGVQAETPPEITKTGRPDDDSFALLPDPPSADVTVALIRLDASDPTEAVQSMATQIAALVPDSGLDPNDFTSYCAVADDRVRGCALEAEGLTNDDRLLNIQMDVDPGDLATRTAPPASLGLPVMQVRVEDLTDPQAEHTETVEESPAPVVEGGGETPDVVWPAMDVEAPKDTPLLDGTWVAPEDGTLLLSGFDPAFASYYAPSSAEAREIVRSYVAEAAPGANVTEDSYEGLNEVSVTYSAPLAGGGSAVGVHVINARGNYVMLFRTPA